MGERAMESEEYADKHPHYLGGYRASAELELLLAHNSFARLIDVGCGDGAFLYYLRANERLNRFAEIWAVDLSARRLQEVVQISDRIVAVQDDGQRLDKVPSSHFDLVVSTQVIEHVQDDAQLLRTLWRISQPGGLVYLETVFKKRYGWYVYRNRHGIRTLDPTHEREYTADEQLLAKVRDAGFRTVLSRKAPVRYPLVQLGARLLKLRDRRLLETPILRTLNGLKIPIAGYRFWILILVKV